MLGARLLRVNQIHRNKADSELLRLGVSSRTPATRVACEFPKAL